LEDTDNNVDTTHSIHTLDGEQPGHDALDLDIIPAPFNRSADKLEDGDNDDGDNDIDNNMSPRPAKRRTSASPRCEPHLRHTSRLSLPQNEYEEGSIEHTDSSIFEDSKDNDISSKRQKFSDPLNNGTDLGSHNGPSQHSYSSISEEAKDDDSESTTVDSGLASTARTSPDAFESASRTEPKSCLEVINANQDWEVRKIIGREDVDGVLHYLVEWCPTLEPQQALEHAKELVDEFEAHLRAQRSGKSGRGGQGLKVKQRTTSGQQQKRARGRAWKQK
jgi:hypothetical protein